jgi:4-amino-4-deoxy-L-arabinose transferase-like glycosyltransferase
MALPPTPKRPSATRRDAAAAPHSDDEAQVAPASLWRLRVTLLVAALLGVALWAAVGTRGWWTKQQLIALAGVAAVAAVPPARRATADAVEWLRRLGRPGTRRATAIVFGAAFVYLVSTAIFQGRDLFPKWHDHQMTLLQARMLAAGRLWLPQHPCADFFETFYVFVKPVYAPMYFPGGALAFVPALWLGIAPWVYSALLAAGVVALLFRIVAKSVDPAAGLVAAALLVSLADVRRVAVWVTSHHVLTLLALAAVYAWMRWRERAGEPAGGRAALGWAAVIGAAMGWAAVTRPVDAIAYAVPLGLVMAWDLRRVGWGRRIATVLVAFAAATPFLCLQLALNKAVTGSWLKTPVQHYTEVELPGLAAFGGGSNPAEVRAASSLPQKQAFARYFAIPMQAEYLAESTAAGLRRKAAVMFQYGVPGSLALFILPLAIPGLRDPRRWVLAATPVTFLAGYLFYPTILSHYTVVVAPGLVLWLVVAARVCERALPARPAGLRTTLCTLVPLALAAGVLPELSGLRDDPNPWPVTHFNRVVLPNEVQTPAVVLFRYHPASSFHEEPVYNDDAARPDDNPVVRAHDLGERNVEIFRYYAQHQPDRTFYLFDRGDASLQRLGTAAELAALHSAGAPVAPPATDPATAPTAGPR